MNFTKQNIAYIAVAVVTLAIAIFAVLPMLPNASQAGNSIVSTAFALGTAGGAGDGGCTDCGGSTSGGSLGNPGGAGDGGCVGCGGTTQTTTHTNTTSHTSDPDPVHTTSHTNDRTDDPLDTRSADPKPVCKFLKVEGKGDGGADNTVQVPYGTKTVDLRYNTVYASKVTLNGKELSKKVNLDGRTTKLDFNNNGIATFRLVAKNAQGSDACVIKVKQNNPPAPKCVAFNADTRKVPAEGGSVKLTWETKNAEKVVIVNTATGKRVEVGKDTNTSGRSFNVNENTTFRLVVYGADGSKDNHCEIPVTLKTSTPDPKECEMKITKSVNKSYAKVGDELTYRINVKNIGDGDCTGGGVQIVDQIDSNIDFVRDYHTGEVSGGYGSKPVYDSGSHTLYWNAHTLTPGESVTIDWVGKVEDTNKCDFTVYNTAKVTAKELNNFGTWITSNRVSTQIDGDCTTPEAPRCVYFNASPDDLPEDGGNVSLSWATENADSVILNPGNRSVAKNDSDYDVYVDDDTTYTLTLKADGFNDVTCYAHVDVDDNYDDDISCSRNVDVWKANDYNVNEGSDVKLTWETHGLDSVSITDLGSVNDDGSEWVNIDRDTTYVLTGRKDGQTIRCEIDVDVESGGGGGGGSSNPRCEFDASDTTIEAGDEVTLSWETRYGRELTIYEGDEDDEKIYETDDDDTVDEGEIKVRPKEDTTYTLVVERGSRDRKCDVDIKVKEDDDVVVTSYRAQGQVAGISLTAVPYTGFDAGPMLTFIFYAVLAIWGLFVAYFLVIRKDTVLGVSFAGAYPRHTTMAADYSTEARSYEPETSEAAAYVGSVLAPAPTVEVAPVAPVATPTPTAAPANLPTGTAPVVGYAAAVAEAETEEVDEMKVLEDVAHENRALLSSDALRHFIAAHPHTDERVAALTAVIEKAKVEFPSEDGWTVINLDRMQTLTEEVEAVAEVPLGTGSLAEAIVAGNIAAAYQMVGHRPMVALADAAADLDAIYRGRNGEQVAVSDMLLRESARLETAQIVDAIAALTSALDGTYSDEAEAVKMAILKATKATS